MTPAAYAEVDLVAIRHNLNKVREYAPSAKIMAVIKANGYGHGLVRIAHALEGVDAYAVARVDEAIYLRQAGICSPIAVLEGFTLPEELDAFVRYDLDAIVHSANQIELFETHRLAGQISVWLKLDTGMNRLGFKPDEFHFAYHRLQQCQKIKAPIRLLTHLANADDKHDDKTQQQIDLFFQIVASYKEPKSIANSAGIMGWPMAITEWVRPGIMLYGISPFPEFTGSEFGLKPIMGLYSRLISVKQIDKGETVGYGMSWTCKQPTMLGVVAVGYGDGYPRYARTGTPVLVNGQRVPLIGRVSMDMITVDLETQPKAKAGDPVCLWGPELPVEEIAHYSGTIPYTLVCGITQRVQIVATKGEPS